MIDGRLLVPAASAWFGVAVASTAVELAPTTVQRHDVAIAVLRIGVGVLLVLLVVAEFVRRSMLLAAPLLLAATCVVLGLLVACTHLAVLTSSPLATWIDARATATIQGVVVTEAVARDSPTAAVWQSPFHVEARLSSSRLTSRGTSIDVDIPILLRLQPDVDVPPPGSEVEVVGRLAPIPWRTGSAAVLSVRGSAAIVVLKGAGSLDVVTHAMRIGLRDAVADLPPDAGSLVAGLAVGDESGQSPELADAMRSSGLSHLTAVSGGNVAILLVAVLGVSSLLRLRLVGRALAGLMAICFFVVLVGPQPSVLRAGVMGGIVVLGLVFGGRQSGPSVLAASVLVLVVTAPALAASWAFALSVFATGGLILLAPRLQERLAVWRLTRRWPPALRHAVGLTAAAQLATLPVLVAMGGATGWVSLPANLLAMPAVAPITVLGLAAAGLAPVAAAPATAVAHVASWPAAWIAWVAHWASGLPMSGLPGPTGVWGVVVLAAVAVASWATARLLLPRWPVGGHRGVRVASIVLLVIVVIVSTVLPPDRRGWPPEGWLMIMCDVGQGDALLLRSGADQAVVVDAGPDPDLVDNCLDDAGIVSVPAVVLTHFHADHVGGLSGVLRGRSVAQVLVSPIRQPADEANGVDRLLSKFGLRATVLTAGDARSVGAVAWQAIWPRRVIRSGSVPNNASIVLIATVSGRRILLTGDIEPESQAAVSADLRGRHFDVVKVPHHGSRYQNPQFTRWAPASVALISVGRDNDYGHPAPDTIASWREAGALVARTDLQGDVAVVPVGAGVGVVGRSADQSSVP